MSTPEAKQAEELLNAVWSEKEEEEHNDFLDRYINGDLPRYKNHFDLEKDNWEDELNAHPLFMTKAPTEEEIKNNAELQGLAEMIYEDMDPVDNAEYCKDMGNTAFKIGTKKELQKAVDSYTAGIKLQCDKMSLVASLYANRAMAHIKLKNYRYAINDCERVLKCDPDHDKAFYRSAFCYNKLGKHELALRWCDKGLQIHPTNKSIITLRADIAKELARINKEKRIKERNQKAKDKKRNDFLALLENRGIKLKPHPSYAKKPFTDILANPSGEAIHTDEDSNVYVPVMFLYPEAQQSDFIAHFNDLNTFSDHFEGMFTEQLPWDTHYSYRYGNLDLYFEYEDSNGNPCLQEVSPDKTLLETLQLENCYVIGGLINFLVIAKDSTSQKQYFENFKTVKHLRNK